jgi:hypothetical protein
LTVGFADFPAFLKHLLHERIAGECPARPPPVFDAAGSGLVGQQLAEPLFQ